MNTDPTLKPDIAALTKRLAEDQGFAAQVTGCADVERDCPACDGTGLVRLMTSHLGPDDYEYDDQCQDCAGSGSADPKTAIESLPYSLHRVRGCEVIERAAVLRIVEAHLARSKRHNAEVTGLGRNRSNDD